VTLDRGFQRCVEVSEEASAFYQTWHQALPRKDDLTAMKSCEMMVFRALNTREESSACKDSCALEWVSTTGSVIRESVETARG
jgi:hypothetical protein